MMDIRGVERQAYSNEAPGKSPVVHSSENCKGTGSRQQTSQGLGLDEGGLINN